MLGYLLLLVIVTLAIWTTAARIHRVRIRARADQVIAGKRQADATELDKYIIQLTARDAWLIGRGEQDQQRIEQLRNIRNDLTKKHS